MSRFQKILQKMKDSPNNVDFEEVCWLAEKIGFIIRNGSGTSHRVFKHLWIKDMHGSLLNLQEDKGKAKPYQVRQLLGKIEDYNLFEGGELNG